MSDDNQIPFEFASASLVSRLVAAGIPTTIPIVLHRNRRIMLSFSARGGLRVHHGYATAPDRVIAAIAHWARPRLLKRTRRELARIFLEFPVHGDNVPLPRPRLAPPEPGDDQRLARLRELHERFNQRWFDGSLSAVPIEWSGRMRTKLGHYAPRRTGRQAIALSRRHLRRHGWAAVTETLLHEMVHQWQDETGLPVDHGRAFRRKAREVGIEPRARAVISPRL